MIEGAAVVGSRTRRPGSEPVVGVIGGGQLARMMAQAAVDLPVHLRVLAATTDDCAVAVVPDVVIGKPADVEAVARFAADCDVVTFDHEQVPVETMRRLAAEGAVLRPGPDSLVYAQDKVELRRFLAAAGLPSPAWAVLDRPPKACSPGSDTLMNSAVVDQASALADRVGWPLVFKLSRGGYDGRGVWVVPDAAAARDLLAEVPLDPDQQWLVEQQVLFDRELAVLAVRSAGGEMCVYPVVETVQHGGMCHDVIAPAPALAPELDKAGRRLAERIAEGAGVVGVLAVELFESEGRLLINELAMRPHNSGHWTMDGAVTSQFENHLRAVLGWSLGDTRPRDQVTAMVNVVGREASADALLCAEALAVDPGARVHLYGKSPRPGRKLGHVNVCGDDSESVVRRAHRVAELLVGSRREVADATASEESDEK